MYDSAHILKYSLLQTIQINSNADCNTYTFSMIFLFCRNILFFRYRQRMPDISFLGHEKYQLNHFSISLELL